MWLKNIVTNNKKSGWNQYSSDQNWKSGSFEPEMELLRRWLADIGEAVI